MTANANAPTHDTNALRDKLLKARFRLLSLHPFFGYLVSNLQDTLGATHMPTVSTDGRVLNWNNDFLTRLSLEDVVYVLAHEALHCALLHPWRRGGRDIQAWNRACDAAVNDMLADAGFNSKLAGLRGAKGRSAERMYDEVYGAQVQAAKNGKPNQKDKGETLDDHGDWEEGDPNEPDDRMLADSWKASLHQARMFGREPMGMSRQLDELLNPKRDWRDLLREGLFFPEDYSWVPPDRRFTDVILPTLTGRVHRVVVAIDTSGSVQGDQLAGFWAELVAILRNNRCEARVLACDAAIQNEWDETEFEPELLAKVKGGGGTSFVPVFERLTAYIESGWRPEALVYLTDLDGSFPNDAPDVRTLWVVDARDANKTAPFGEVIPIEG